MDIGRGGLSDTSPDAQAVLDEGFRRMTPEQKVARAFGLRRLALDCARAGIRDRFGELPEREVRLRLASTWLDADTMRTVFGWDPDAR